VLITLTVQANQRRRDAPYLPEHEYLVELNGPMKECYSVF